MLPNNIDLTENLDFSRGDAPRHGGFDIGNYIKVHYRGMTLTSNEYEKIKQRESIFGEVHHYNEAKRIFALDNEGKSLNENDTWRTTCCNCGKDTKAPWNIYYGLCSQCCIMLSIEKNHSGYIPSYTHRRPHILWNHQENIDVSRNLFSLR